MIVPGLLLDAMTSSGVFLKSAYKTPANFNDRRSGRHGLATATPSLRPKRLFY
jgi:hypothetical protein